MDFTFTPESDEAVALVRSILGEQCSPAMLKALETQGDRYDLDVWNTLADAGLLSLSLAEQWGGAGLGLVDACPVIVECGRALAPAPVATHIAAAQLVAELGSDEQQHLWLFGAATGERRFSAAVAEDLAFAPALPQVRAVRRGESWALTGTKTLVRAAAHSDAILVTANTDDGVGVFLVEALADGMEIADQHTSDRDRAGLVTFADTTAELVGSLDGSTVTRLHDLLAVTSCAELLGITEGALALTASYATTREQFGRPIGTFQGVRHRLADGHIDVLGQRLTLWQAVWRVAEGLPDTTEVAPALLWAADAAHRVAHTAVHVHGGVGIDLDGEAHRYFTAAKRWEFTFAGATAQALTIGRALADG